MIPAKLKTRSCRLKSCQKEFTQERPGQLVCSWQCGKALIEEKGLLAQARRLKRDAKAVRTETKAKLTKLKPRKHWLAKAKRALHAYVRLRDIKAGHNCICCNEPFEPNKPGGSVDAGHFRSVGSAKHLELEAFNIHAQRKGCNRSGHNRYEAYRLGLIARIGLERVEAIERDQEPRKYTIDRLQALEVEYKAKRKQLEGV